MKLIVLYLLFSSPQLLHNVKYPYFFQVIFEIKEVKCAHCKKQKQNTEIYQVKFEIIPSKHFHPPQN